MKNRPHLALVVLLMIALGACNVKNSKKTSADETSEFNEEILAYYQKTIDSAGFYLNKMDSGLSLEANRDAWMHSRKWYKRAEPIMIAYDFENYKTLNAPNLLKVEIEDYTDVKVWNPRSYQVLEEILFDDVSAMEELDQVYLQNTISFMKARVPSLAQNHMIGFQKDRHHLKLIRDAIVNIATKGITGFDSPMLANSLIESAYNYEGILAVLTPYEAAFKNQELYQQWTNEINEAKKVLMNGNFDAFDRYEFIQDHIHKQLTLINLTAQDWEVEIADNTELNPQATNLFAEDFFNKAKFSVRGTPASTEGRIALGKALFNDPNLSRTGNMSCGTCHKVDLAFTDGLPKAVGNNGKELLRNTMTLPYAVYQKSFFLDGSSSSLEGQIVSVTNNANEFHIDLKTLEEKVRSDEKYQVEFEKYYAGDISELNIRNAIANYIRDLTPFDSRFDLNMQGVEESLSEQEIEGFNLFMGKAACATCHFPPSFHGTIPPKYTETEFESLGVPANASFTNPVMDLDPGLFYPYEVEERRYYFKTPTVRNIEKTGPYMHNGVYNTLEEVLTFYNVGGGVGMGFDHPMQTLPGDSLNLSDAEVNAIIAFMKSLTDSPPVEDNLISSK